MEDYILWFFYGLCTTVLSLWIIYISSMLIEATKGKHFIAENIEKDVPISDNKDDLDFLFSELENKKLNTSKEYIHPTEDKEIRSGTYSSLETYGGRVSNISKDQKSLISKYSIMLCNTSYLEACSIAAQDGYNIHVLYVGISTKMPLDSRSDNTIGVRIKDPQFDYKNFTPSKYSIVTEVIDIGGVDANNFGLIKL